jgi:hypothetical protein
VLLLGQPVWSQDYTHVTPLIHSYLQELKDKDALLKQQQVLLQVAQEQKVRKGLCLKHA